MRFFSWLRETLERRRLPPREMVRFVDAEYGRVVRIPASELCAGVVPVRLEGTGELAWSLPVHPQTVRSRPPAADEGAPDVLRRVQAAFAEHRPLSLEQWEAQMSGAADPDRELVAWSHAADVYGASAAGQPCAARRRDFFRCVMACMATHPGGLSLIFQPHVLTPGEVATVVQRYFGWPD
jgi:hypothetical protein